MSDQDNEKIVAEEAAIRFADRDDEEAINLLMGHLKGPQGRGSPSQRPWRLLMDIYQAKEDKASFEKAASMFTERFHTSPPSWRDLKVAKPAPVIGRNVLILSGFPSAIHPEKWRDFLNASRDQKFCRLDLSRLELPEANSENLVHELRLLTELLGRMTRLRLKVMLMGDGELMQRLRQGVDDRRWQGEVLQQAWLLLLILLQWRGQQEEFEQRAMDFVDAFECSPLGYEADAALAMDEPSTQTPAHETAVWDEALAQGQVDALRQQYESKGVAKLDLSKVLRITYPAALAMAASLSRLGFDARRVEFLSPSEMLVALFDATGVSPQVSYMGRHR